MILADPPDAGPVHHRRHGGHDDVGRQGPRRDGRRVRGDSQRPPLVLVAIDGRAEMSALLDEGKRIGISVLSEEQEALSRRFVTERGGSTAEPTFDVVRGTPVVEDALAQLIARVEHVHGEAIIRWPWDTWSSRATAQGYRSCRGVAAESRCPRRRVRSSAHFRRRCARSSCRRARACVRRRRHGDPRGGAGRGRLREGPALQRGLGHARAAVRRRTAPPELLRDLLLRRLRQGGARGHRGAMRARRARARGRARAADLAARTAPRGAGRVRTHRGSPRRRAVRRVGDGARGARGRRAPQRGRQGRRRAVPGGPASRRTGRSCR